MTQPGNVDTTLKERHAILLLLRRMHQKDVTVSEMEEIGEALRQSGNRALSLLLRKLESERDSTLISRYLSLLDFFDDEEWLSQFVQIAIQRRDLDGEGKAVLLAALKGHGLDVTAPPFARILHESGAALEAMVVRLFDLGEDGYLLFMEDFLCHSVEVQLELVRELGTIPDARVPGLLEILLWFDHKAIAREAVSTLGRIRMPEAAAVLAAFLSQAGDELREDVRKNLRRLEFLGIGPAAAGPEKDVMKFHGACAGPVDSSGCRSLWVSRWRDHRHVASLYLHVHETDGIKGAWGCPSASPADVDRHLRDVCEEEGLVPVPVEYLLSLVRDAIARTEAASSSLPAEFHVLRPYLFRNCNVAPKPYHPAVGGQEGGGHAPTATDTILDDDFFAGWFLATPRVYDFAEELNAHRPKSGGQDEDEVMERFCRELIVPDLGRIRQRLVLTADLMRQANRDDRLIELTLAAAASLPAPHGSCHGHPFLRRFAKESLEIAREALAEGFDLRQQLELDDAE